VLYGLSAMGWFNLAYAALAILLITLFIRHKRHPLAVVPESALGKGQLLYVIFLWWVVIGNFERAVVGFAPQRLVTEGVILLNAIVCTFLVLIFPGFTRTAPDAIPPSSFLARKLIPICLAAALLSIPLDWL